ncbi:MAG: LPXTG cell wall anchor domain-containing protein [Acidimicrobiales bacterium]
MRTSKRLWSAGALALALGLSACSSVDLDAVAPAEVYTEAVSSTEGTGTDSTGTDETAADSSTSTTTEAAAADSTEATSSTTTEATSTTDAVESTTTTTEAAVAADESTTVPPAQDVAGEEDELTELPNTGPDEVVLLIAIGCALLVGGRSLVDATNAAQRRLLLPIRRHRSMPPR